MSQLADLYWSEVGRVHRYVRARVGADAAEDITGEVFHAAAVAVRDGRGSQVTPAWLMTVARNKVIDLWRRESTRSAKRHLLAADESALPPDWASDERHEAVLSALDRLKPRHRSLLILHHVDGLPISDLAAANQQSVRAVESALARARAAFRREYDRSTP